MKTKAWAVFLGGNPILDAIGSTRLRAIDVWISRYYECTGLSMGWKYFRDRGYTVRKIRIEEDE